MDELEIARAIAARDGADELDIAEAIRDGKLGSPQHYENVWLFQIRVTGTGAAYRDKHREYVWRDPSEYLDERFLRRCAGLPIIIEHPDTKMLDGKEFQDRIVGTVFVPFIKGDEVHAIVKIWDEATAALLQDEQLSTSPAVVFREPDIGKTINIGDGEHLLIEGKPALLDHCALCVRGVWDKSGPPSGVLLTPDESTDMAEHDERDRKDAEEKERADRARHDSDIMTKLDSIMSSLDNANKRMDALEARHRKDAEDEGKERKDAEREAKEREDAARAAAAKKDAEVNKAEEEKQAKELEKLAAEEREEGERDDSRHLGRRDGETCAAHSARIDALAKKHRHDRMSRRDEESEEEHSKRCDAHHERHDAETEEERRALEKAEEAKKAKERDDAASRHDAALERENAELRRRLVAVEGTVREMTRETTAEERDALAAAQARADGVACLFGERVPAPTPGETSLAYRRRLIQRFQKHSPNFKSGSFATMDAATLALVERQVYADAQTAATAVAEGKPGLLVPMVSSDAAGRQITRFHGDPMAWMQTFCRGSQICEIRKDRI